MSDDLETRKPGPRGSDFRAGELIMHDAGAIGGYDFLVHTSAPQLGAHIVSHQPVGHEKDAFLRQASDDVVNVARGDAYIRLGFYLRGTVDVTDHGGIWVERLEAAHALTRDRVGQ